MIVWELVILSSIISIILIIINNYINKYMRSKQEYLWVEIYECGFNIYRVNKKLLARFYLVGILFLLFDLEVSYLIIISIVSEVNILNNIENILCICIIVLSIGMMIEYYNNVIGKSGL